MSSPPDWITRGVLGHLPVQPSSGFSQELGKSREQPAMWSVRELPEEGFDGDPAFHQFQVCAGQKKKLQRGILGSAKLLARDRLVRRISAGPPIFGRHPSLTNQQDLQPHHPQHDEARRIQFARY